MKKRIVIVGGGACALMLGSELDTKKFDVSVYEKNPAAGRKFLVAGDGGLNLTHSEPPEKFITRYTPSDFLKTAFNGFSNHAFMAWLETAGIKLFTGTSGRVFPARNMKPIDVLNVFLKKMAANNTRMFYRHTWLGFHNNEGLIFDHNGTRVTVQADVFIFCLGGASWPVTGSSGEWLTYFGEKQLSVKTFSASNCAYGVNWPREVVTQIAGKALKNISITCGNMTHHGEVVVTEFGLEGSGIYPLSPVIRTLLQTTGKAELVIDFKPALSHEDLISKLNSKNINRSYSEHVSTSLNLSPVQIKLVKSFLSKEEFLNIDTIAHRVKHFQLTVRAAGALEDAISSVGGIALEELNADFELKKLPKHFCIGEMLDYDAPTGGYLLQSCFTMAKYLATRLNETA